MLETNYRRFKNCTTKFLGVSLADAISKQYGVIILKERRKEEKENEFQVTQFWQQSGNFQDFTCHGRQDQLKLYDKFSLDEFCKVINVNM